jgi:alginate production protein
MHRTYRTALAGLCAVLCLLAAARAFGADEQLRERLTEREDKRRSPAPYSVDIAGRALTLSGEYEISLNAQRRRIYGNAVRERDRSLFEQGIDAEAFYSFGKPLSLFAQLAFAYERDLLKRTPEKVSESFAERGEMWLVSENIGGSNFSMELGRLNFEDDRRWWWDDELDAVLVSYERPTLGIDLAYGRELAPRRLDRSRIDPDEDGVQRLIAEVSWDFHPGHAAELFLLRTRDGSRTERPEQVLRRKREDESDANLTWFGVRLMGAFDLGQRGVLGYWFDQARVRGRESVVEYEELEDDRSRSEVESILKRDVRGWAVDMGVNWLLPLAWEPRVFAGYAIGSGDGTPNSDGDRAFRQTGLHGNESGFGGVRRFAHYGVALDPELSNLRVLTLGAGCALWKSSSLDIVFHRYRLMERGEPLRDSALDFEPAGLHRDLGSGLDIVLGLEEWERLEFEFTLSAFRAGRAFGADDGRKSYRALVSMRYAF